jgi:antitoxin component YwqK of YwqJK toxin-antitoxin module
MMNEANMTQQMNMLDYLKTEYKQYIDDPMHVYKSCDDTWLVIMRKLLDTITNEGRDNVEDANYAKFRANKLKVIKIINLTDGSLINSIENRFDHSSVTYAIDTIVFPNRYDMDKNKICTNGIHYFKTLDAAFYYQVSLYNQPNFTGVWRSFHDNGNIFTEEMYINGLLNGPFTEWNVYGIKTCEGEHLNDNKENNWISWYNDGTKHSEGNYVNNDRHGHWTHFYGNGNKEYEGEYANDRKHGRWTYFYPNGDKKSEGEYIDDKRENEWIFWDHTGATFTKFYKNGIDQSDKNNKYSKYVYAATIVVSIGLLLKRFLF